MKKIIWLLPLFLLAINISAKEWQTIRIGTEGAYPPFNTIDKDGKLVGLEIDFVNALCDELKVKCTLVSQDWDGIIPALLAKKYDAIFATMSITEDRLKSISFTRPYLKGGNSFVGKPTVYKTTTPADLAGKIIGVQEATISEDFVKGNYTKSTVRTYGKVDDAFLDLAAGRLDLVFNDTISNYGSFLDLPEGKNYAIVGPEYFDTKWFGAGVGAGVRKEDADLVELLNKGINALYAKNKVDPIFKKWVPKQNLLIKE